MGLNFNDSHGAAIKNTLEYIKFEFGINKFRLVGQIRPRYAYWKQAGTNSIPVECLAFNPEQERFTNVDTDWFKHYFPQDERGEDTRPVWSYVAQVIDDKDNTLKLCGLKRKLWDQILDAAKDLGDPTDPETGWWIVVDKKKTGPQRFNVEYALQVLKCSESKGPLTEEQMEVYETVKPIDELIPRPTPDEQKAFIERMWLNKDKEEENADKEAIDELSDTPKTGTDDVPF
jgi:hypothetical protein